MATKTRIRGEQELNAGEIESDDQVFHNHAWWVVSEVVVPQEGYYQLFLARRRSQRSATTAKPWVRDDAVLRVVKVM